MIRNMSSKLKQLEKDHKKKQEMLDLQVYMMSIS